MPVRPHAHGEEGEEPEVGRRVRGAPPRSVEHAQEQVHEAAVAGHIKDGEGTSRTTPAGSPSDDQVTHLSGTPGGKPDGHPRKIEPADDAETKRSIEMEHSAAVELADQGWRIKQNPSADEVAQARVAAGDTGDPNKNPDYLLEGRVFDCISPTKPTKSPRNIASDVRDKVDAGQTQRVVINLEDWRGDLSALRQQFADWPVPGLKEAKAILPDGSIVQIDLPEQSG